MVIVLPYLCKNICVREKTKPDNWDMPFLSHGRCRTCQVWLKYPDDFRCSCCGSKLARRPREWAKRIKYREV